MVQGKRTYLTGMLVLLCGWMFAGSAAAQGVDPNRHFYYPHYYYPQTYWPALSPQYPEPLGAPYRPAPAYMAVPQARSGNARYEFLAPQRYYRGFHFWLDQF